MLADSGNSADLLYAIDVGNTGYGFELVRQVLTARDKQFSDGAVQVDSTAIDAVLLCPVYGTLTATAEEPIFRSAILHLPEPLVTIDAERLRSLPGCRKSRLLSRLFRPSGHLREQCVLELEAWTPTGVLHEAYQVFCEDQTLDTIAAPHFARALSVHFNLRSLRRKVQGVVELVRGIRGIKLRGTE